MPWTNVLASILLALPARPCLVFVVSDGKEVFVGNNEDYLDPDTNMWFVPGEGGTHGRVYFGFSNGFPQGGMNDAGLCFDGLALDREDVKSTTPKPAFAGNLSDEAMAKCASVAQVIDLFESHDRAFLAGAQLLFADRSGDGVIIEGNAMIRKGANRLVATNYRQSHTPRASTTCPRYLDAERILDQVGHASVDVCRKVLAATHQEGEVSTIYSNVYDLERGLIHLYHFHDYENVVVVDLASELAKGAHSVKLASLFPETFAFSSFRGRIDQRATGQREALRDKRVDPTTFADYVGRYRYDDGVATRFEFSVRSTHGVLTVAFGSQGEAELTPRGASSFVAISGLERADFDFERGPDGKVCAAVLKQSGLTFKANRIE